tara:strand:- start:437 stop:538 length:102 start_codon:yes stop_codon:yes gene_type:complete
MYHVIGTNIGALKRERERDRERETERGIREEKG